MFISNLARAGILLGVVPCNEEGSLYDKAGKRDEIGLATALLRGIDIVPCSVGDLLQRTERGIPIVRP